MNKDINHDNPLVKQKLEYWKKKLIDLSKRNNLINYRFTKSKSLKVNSLSLKQIVLDISDEKNILFIKNESKSPKEREWSLSTEDSITEKKLSALYNKSKENYLELGINTLFISLGILKYMDVDSDKVFLEAPIFLCPVEFERIKSSSVYHKFGLNTSAGEISLNPALKEKLSHDFKIIIRELDENESIFDYLKYLETKISEMKNWQVLEDIYIDIFSYQKYIMYEDLNSNSNLVEKSTLIQNYMGLNTQNNLLNENSNLVEDDFDDAKSVDILPADSSQKKAIEFAKLGKSFVLQGPPGTGKSQTIVNIISALMEQKKRILFVSQKMAALDVVQKRLDDVGLGRYCLNLHTYKSDKKEIINQLMAELTTSPKIPAIAQNYSFENYLLLQLEINNYYKFLCERNPVQNLSIYDLRGKLSKLHKIDTLEFDFKTLLELNSQELDFLRIKLEIIDEHLEKIKNPLFNIFYNYKLEKNTVLNRNKFDLLLNDYCINLESLSHVIKKLDNNTHISITSFEDLKFLAEIENKLSELGFERFSSWMFEEDFRDKLSISNELANLHLDIEKLESFFLERVEDNFLTTDLTQSEKIFKNTNILNRFFNVNYKEEKNILDKKFSKRNLSHSNWIKLFDSKLKYQKLSLKLDEFLKLNQEFSKLLKNYKDKVEVYNLNNTLNELYNIYIFADKLLVNNKLAIKYLVEKNLNLTDKIVKINFFAEQLNDYFDKKIINLDNEFELISNQGEELKTNLSILSDILQFKDAIFSLDTLAREFLYTYLKSDLKSKFSEVFFKSYYLELLEKYSYENKLPPKILIEKFKSEDLNTRNMKRFKVMQIIENSQPKEMHVNSTDNEISILKRESEKKRKLKPIRTLIEEIPNLIFTLKPCFMMSPLTVSQYINPEHISFDVVIYDEASQIMPEDAITSLIRSKQTIIIGDTKQLPPTSFFLNQDEEELENEDIEDLESFLSQASTTFDNIYLKWHYRSKNENLIAFSNTFFYENKLITFPSPKIEDTSGLEFVYVKGGIYDRGNTRKNSMEAKKIIEVYKKIKNEFPEKSVGIIAFSISQENAILNAFEVAKVSMESDLNSTLNEDLFVKNLETVQGDERDIIILSIGYGPDSNGKLNYNFGPINRDGGYKRLNVAITRSRFKTIVVSSINPDELDDSKINTIGARHLKNYLDFAKNKNIEKFKSLKKDFEFDSDFEESVYTELKNLNYKIERGIGTSEYKLDIAIKNPKNENEYLLAIELDGAKYDSSKYARDRDKIRVNLLESLGWNIHRVWSVDWLNNRESEIEKIKSKLESISQNNFSKIKKHNKNEFSKIEDISDFKEINLNQKYKEYEICKLKLKDLSRKFRSNDYLKDDFIIDLVEKRLVQVIIEEGPIEKELLFKRVSNSVGIENFEKVFTEKLIKYLRKLAAEDTIYINGNTFADKEFKLIYPRVSTEVQRPFILIPKEELAGAIFDILKITFSSTRDALTNDLLKGIYANKRVNFKVEEKIDEVINYLLDLNYIEEKNGKIQLLKKN